MLLSKSDQINYFKNVIEPLFSKELPEQVIFSFLKNDLLVGYGGLVHINWEEKSAEISFLTETRRSKISEKFISDWSIYLGLIKRVANEYLNFKSIFTYAYDIRPALYVALEKCGFKETTRVKNGIDIGGILKDIVIHTFTFKPLNMRLATKEDVDKYFDWANDATVRHFSFQSNTIIYEDHVQWFKSKIENKNFTFYLFETDNKEAVGQVRLQRQKDEVIIGISIDSKFRGFGFGAKMLRMACSNFSRNNDDIAITAYIKIENVASKTIFERAGFVLTEQVNVSGMDSQKLILRK